MWINVANITINTCSIRPYFFIMEVSSVLTWGLTSSFFIWCVLILDKESYYPLIDVNWWADSSVILARCSGALTVSSVKTLRNLLGKACEWFESSPQVTSAHDGGFLSLEVRNVHKHIILLEYGTTICFFVCDPKVGWVLK